MGPNAINVFHGLHPTANCPSPWMPPRSWQTQRRDVGIEFVGGWRSNWITGPQKTLKQAMANRFSMGKQQMSKSICFCVFGCARKMVWSSSHRFSMSLEGLHAMTISRPWKATMAFHLSSVQKPCWLMIGYGVILSFYILYINTHIYIYVYMYVCM